MTVLGQLVVFAAMFVLMFWLANTAAPAATTPLGLTMQVCDGPVSSALVQSRAFPLRYVELDGYVFVIDSLRRAFGASSPQAAALVEAAGRVSGGTAKLVNEASGIAEARRCLEGDRAACTSTLGGITPIGRVARLAKLAEAARAVTKVRAAKAAGRSAQGFHYTTRAAVSSIETKGLLPGSYATSRRDLSPLQAQLDLALPPNRPLRDAVVRVDLAGLRRAGYEVPEFTRVAGSSTCQAADRRFSFRTQSHRSSLGSCAHDNRQAPS